ncbi:phytoene/squalene synthase family protein [Novispirillum sp. DQ9]|uniref:phytoene/squalene synthase family protein n=1 Tax=Novispirillum sp. DQ9 TaxID=3398612 RepID=UPI003C7C2863
MADVPPLSHAAALVRRHDPDRFLTALFAPVERREDLMALYAFNLEVARIRETVSEPMLGLMRVQWWRDVVSRHYEGRAAPPGHPVALALTEAITRHDLPRDAFERLLDGRDLDMEPEPVPDRPALRSYAAATGGTLAQLALRVLGDASEAGQEAAGAVGRAWALAGLLRAVPFHALQDRLYLPAADIGAEARSALREGRAAPEVCSVVADIAAEAAAALAGARSRHPRPGRATVAALLPALLVDGHLRRLRHAGHDPFAPRLRLPKRRPVALLLHALAGRY